MKPTPPDQHAEQAARILAKTLDFLEGLLDGRASIVVEDSPPDVYPRFTTISLRAPAPPPPEEAIG